MFLGPLQHWAGEYRRRQCTRSLYPSLTLLVDKAHLAGWSREEVLIAIADAADHQLADITGSCALTVIDNDDPQAEAPGKPVQKQLAVPENAAEFVR